MNTKYIGWVTDYSWYAPNMPRSTVPLIKDKRIYSDECEMCFGMYAAARVIKNKKPIHCWPGIFAARQWMKLVGRKQANY